MSGAGDLTFTRWLRLTWFGWLLGVPIIVVLAVIGDAVGLEGQSLVGAGMGLGVGLMQARAARAFLARTAGWTLSSVLGLAAPFLVSDLSGRLGWEMAYSLYVCVAAGGVVVGVGQAFFLRSRARSAWVWVGASALGWTLAGGSAAIADALFQSRAVPGIPGALAYLGIIASGGLVLGAVTGVALTRMIRPAALAEERSAA